MTKKEGKTLFFSSLQTSQKGDTECGHYFSWKLKEVFELIDLGINVTLKGHNTNKY